MKINQREINYHRGFKFCNVGLCERGRLLIQFSRHGYKWKNV